jgi:hypothetical protein
VYFATPFWLFALLPWLILAGWMLWGRRRRVPVPFLPMWEGPALAEPPRRGLRLPPAGVILAMAALLLAIVAAGGPMLKRGRLGSAEPALTVIVDHGLTTSGKNGGETRFVAAARELTRLVGADEPQSLPIVIVDPLTDQEQRTDLGGLVASVAQLPRTALDMRPQTAAAVGRAISQNGPPAVVLTDRPVDSSSARVVRVSPPGPWNDIAITAISARATPAPQVMVRLRNDSPATGIAATIRSESQSISRTLTLPTRGNEQDYFFDLPPGETVEAAVGNNRAYLLREGISAKIEPAPDLPASVARMIRVYARQRGKSQAGATRQTVQVVTSLASIAGATPAVIVAPATDVMSGSIMAIDDPITRDVHWSAIPGPIHISSSAPQGWKTVVSMGGQAMVAVREVPARQAWVGFDAEGFSATPAFVVFWTNLLDWVAGSAHVYSASPVIAQMDGWRRMPLVNDPEALVADAPGIYARGDGSKAAFDSPVLPPPTPSNADEPEVVHHLAALIGNRPSGRDAAPIVLWLSLACLIIAAAVWKRAGTGAG